MNDEDIYYALGINKNKPQNKEFIDGKPANAAELSSINKNKPQNKEFKEQTIPNIKNHRTFIKISKVFLTIFLFGGIISGFLTLGDDDVIGIAIIISTFFLYIISYAIIYILENTEKNI